jgi:putative molybdopterin biosynthesis protein
MLAAGNPKGIKGIANLARTNVHFVNRNAGSGTRLWLDSQLQTLRIPSEKIRGYGLEVETHSEAASLIEAGKADASIALQAAAHQDRLDFIPLFEERYDLVLPRGQEKQLAPLFDYIQTREFRNTLNSLTGYNTTHSGEQILL